MESKTNVNLEEIKKIPEKEFKKFFSNWLEEKDLSRELQAKLRKDLIQNFNKTSLGRQIFSQHVKSQRMILSPLILALNALVAEFLYAQNCHFSLSVFSTEVPYRNTLPDFENTPNFRFNKNELFEIFDAIDGNIPMETKKLILTKYLESSTEGTRVSCLYAIFKTVFKLPSQHLFEEYRNSKKMFGENVQVDKENPAEEKTDPGKKRPDEEEKNYEEPKNNSKKETNNPNYNLYNKHFHYFNKYLILLSKKVKEMSQSLDQLGQKDEKTVEKCINRKSLQTRKVEQLNKSLEKISENLRVLSLSKRKNKRISAIVQAIDQMSKQFEKCATHFENVSCTDPKVDPLGEKTYSDWIIDLQTTKNGKKFVSKIEASLKKTLDKEKDQLSIIFAEKLENEKEMLKLKYKQKYMEQLNKLATAKDQFDIGKNLNESIDKKLKEFDVRQDELFKKFTQNKENDKAMTKDIDQENEKVKSTENKEYEIASRNQNKLYEQKVFDISPKLQEMAKSIAQQERNIDHIVFDAKLRIQELEHHSTQLDQNFKDYLKRQQTNKIDNRENIESIWDNYNREKNILNKKCAILRNQPLKKKDSISSESKFAQIIHELPQINIESQQANNLIQEEIGNFSKQIDKFENPFRKLQKEILFNKINKNNEKPKTSTIIFPSDSKPAELEISNKILLNLESALQSNLQKKFDGIDQSPSITISNESNPLTKNKINDHPKLVNHITDEATINKATDVQSAISSVINIKDVSLDNIEISPTKSSSTNKSSIHLSSPAIKQNQKVLKSKRNLFPSKEQTTTKTTKTTTSNHLDDDKKSNQGNESEKSSRKSSSDEKGLSQFIIDSQKKNEIGPSSTIQIDTNNKMKKISPKKSGGDLENIFQIGSFLKEEDVSKILESSESLVVSSRIDSDEFRRIHSRQDKKVDSTMLSPVDVVMSHSSSNNSNFSFNLSVGKTGGTNSLEDFWN